MSRALVLGGGGPVGIGWEAGLAVGLAGAGVDLAAADLIVGTSAGSVVGAQVRLGADLNEIVAAVGTPLPVEGGDEAMAGLFNAMAEVAKIDDPREARRALGRVSATSTTVPEDTFLGLFGQVEGVEFPAGYNATAVDIDTGELRIWDRAAGVPLQRAVASSCSVPGIFPPVALDGHRYMDGGMRSALNADVAKGHDAVIAVSCFALSLPEGMSDPMFDRLVGQLEEELAAVRDAGGAVEVVAPNAEMLDLSGWGLNLMDPSRAAAAFEVGQRQAAEEAERLRRLWNR